VQTRLKFQTITDAWPELRPISTQENFPQKENFVQFDWLTQISRRKKNFEVENFQLLM
jgi:hypothetical protein